MTDHDQPPKIIRHLEQGIVCCDPQWEAAYERFESCEQEINKFVSRLKAFGIGRTEKNARIVELFCGRGGGLVALERLGFQNLEGVDLSESLLEKYRGPATLHLADCRHLPLDDNSFSVAIVQGGLHHLPDLPDDLDQVLSEVKRILRSDGTFYVVEPWLTPFLRFVHAIVRQPLVRKFYAKGDALAGMIDHERETYEQWLERPAELLELFHKHFDAIQAKRAWGKLLFVGKPPASTK